MRTGLSLISVLMSAGALGAELPREAAEVALASLIADDRDSKDIVYCISIEEKDASPETLAKLQRPDRVIVAGSKCRFVFDPARGSYEIASKKRAYIVSVAHPQWVSPSALTLELARRHSGKWAYGWTARLEFRDGHWRLLGKSNDWVS